MVLYIFLAIVAVGLAAELLLMYLGRRRARREMEWRGSPFRPIDPMDEVQEDTRLPPIAMQVKERTARDDAESSRFRRLREPGSLVSPFEGKEPW